MQEDLKVTRGFIDTFYITVNTITSLDNKSNAYKYIQDILFFEGYKALSNISEQLSISFENESPNLSINDKYESVPKFVTSKLELLYEQIN